MALLFRGFFHFFSMVNGIDADKRVCCADAWLCLVSDNSPGVPLSCLGEDTQCPFKLGQPELAPPPLPAVETGLCVGFAPVFLATMAVFLMTCMLGRWYKVHKTAARPAVACLAFMTTEGAPTDKPPDAPVEEDEQQARAWDFPFPTPEETAVYHK